MHRIQKIVNYMVDHGVILRNFERSRGRIKGGMAAPERASFDSHKFTCCHAIYPCLARKFRIFGISHTILTIMHTITSAFKTPLNPTELFYHLAITEASRVDCNARCIRASSTRLRT